VAPRSPREELRQHLKVRAALPQALVEAARIINAPANRPRTPREGRRGDTHRLGGLHHQRCGRLSVHWRLAHRRRPTAVDDDLAVHKAELKRARRCPLVLIVIIIIIVIIIVIISLAVAVVATARRIEGAVRTGGGCIRR